MPGMDGLEASRQIKNDPLLQTQPAIIIVTAFGREEVREEAEKLEVDGFLVKPVTKSMLVDSLVQLFATEGDPSAGPEGPPELDTRRLAGLRVLLAEDNEINQQIAVELLEGVGVHIDVANNGCEAVERLAQAPDGSYRVVLMDLQMPEMDGYQATTRIRADARFAELPVVAMTAHATVEERQRCLAAGMNAHVAKPIDPALLFETLGKFHVTSAPEAADSGGAPAPARQGGNPLGAAPPATETLPVVEGLDVDDGLTRVAGNRRLYLRLLRQFLDQEVDAPRAIDEALSHGDSALAERLAHTVKGVAGNLGAHGVQQAAAALEKAIREGDAESEVPSARNAFATALTGLLDRLRAAMPRPPESPPAADACKPAELDPTQAQPVVEEMLAHLDQFDPAAADCLETHRTVFQALLPGEAFDSFEQHITGFSFAEALEELREAASRNGIIES
jgi:two-component system sensor histidine kinase/response regulator